MIFSSNPHLLTPGAGTGRELSNYHKACDNIMRVTYALTTPVHKTTAAAPNKYVQPKNSKIMASQGEVKLGISKG